MKEMRWSWGQLRATPTYVKRICFDFRQIELQREADLAEKSRQEAERARHGR